MEPKRLNKRRLTKKETREITQRESTFDPIKSSVFNWVDFQKNEVYYLPDGNILYVHGDFGYPDKSDIYSKEVFEQWYLSMKTKRRYHELGLGSSLHWFLYYSKFKQNLIEHIEEAQEQLGVVLNVPKIELDYSLNSLDIITNKALDVGVEDKEDILLDGIIAYVGEVIRKKIDGKWKPWEQGDLPSIFKEISWYFRDNWIFPINIAFEAFCDPANFPLRKLVRNSLARFNMTKGLASK
ncbi:MAG: hypothetical protein K9J37_12805 [Saprospiraceae bacterium]|nr:hypothetical protein [Saprospiraceae bacterium]MCF8250787.1 hypothetical protein [Saprospiraceae bacterium]MCF8281765.1 hypothetical protein [Bacteroidales bacterium]MCF8312588.1 hypothetical protein [Saprospiraceae bacterium]MCF8440917.1 hypothetical protein [Saprospiraceae bacterium]